MTTANDINAFNSWLESQNISSGTKLFIHNNYGSEDVIIGTFVGQNAWSFIRYSYNDDKVYKWRKEGNTPISTNITNITNRFDSSVDLSLGVAYTCPNDGIVQYGGNGDSFTVLNVNGVEVGVAFGGNQTNRAVYNTYKVNKGDVVTITNPIGSDSYIHRYYPSI